MSDWLCDKCHKPVPLWNDAIALEYMSYEGRLPYIHERAMYGARHLFRTEGCEGSPSRAQYFYVELSKDTRYPYEGVQRGIRYRIGYAMLKPRKPTYADVQALRRQAELAELASKGRWMSDKEMEKKVRALAIVCLGGMVEGYDCSKERERLRWWSDRRRDCDYSGGWVPHESE